MRRLKGGGLGPPSPRERRGARAPLGHGSIFPCQSRPPARPPPAPSSRRPAAPAGSLEPTLKRWSPTRRACRCARRACARPSPAPPRRAPRRPQAVPCLRCTHGRLSKRQAWSLGPASSRDPRPPLSQKATALPDPQPPKAFWEEDLTHAFCVSLEQSDKVARMVAELAAQAAAAGLRPQAAAARGVVPAGPLAAVSRL
jgi:hypothetical protein